MKEYFVYILECSDLSYYTGVTNNIEIRLNEHNSDKNPNSYTFSRRPVKLVFVETFYDINQAIAREKQLKWWSRKKKEALIEWKFELLPELSRSKSEK